MKPETKEWIKTRALRLIDWAEAWAHRKVSLRKAVHEKAVTYDARVNRWLDEHERKS